jgi:DNA modification methylase
LIAKNRVVFADADINSLKPYPGNPHKHPKRQTEQLRASIRVHGIMRPVLADENGIIIDGEAIWRAAKLEGNTSVSVWYVHGLSDYEKAKLRLALNRIPLNADWAPDELRIEIESILSVEPNLDPLEIGMSVGEVDNILIQKEDDVGDDIVPAVTAHSVTQPGDIWLCADRHRIGCGDARDLDFATRVVGTRPIDCCMTDPPFNKSIVGGATTGRGKTRHAEFAMASGEMSDEEFETVLEEALRPSIALSRDGAVHLVFIDHQHIETLLAVAKRLYSQRLNICIWNKSNGGLGGLYRNKHEMIGVFKVGSSPHFNAVELGKHGRNRTNVWDYPSVNTFGSARRRDLELHPTVKPVALVADAIMDVTRRGDLVFDGFLGSGTTLLACERTGRRFRGIEIHAPYVDVALARWSERTGEEPVLEATGRTFSEVRAERLGREASHD